MGDRCFRRKDRTIWGDLMSESRWVGGLNGSRVGHLFWEEGHEGVGKIALGQMDGKTLTFISKRQTANPKKYDLEFPSTGTGTNEPIGTLNIEFQNQTARAGTWSLNDGSAGTFEVVIKNIGQTAPDQNPLEKSQVQIANKDVPLGAITLYRPDLSRIISELESYYQEPVVPIIRAKEGDQVIVRNAVEYLARGDLPDKVKELSIVVEANSLHGLKKIINLTLSDDLDSKISVSSPDELWTEAVSQRLSRYMTEFTSSFTGLLRRHGLNINSIILVMLLVALPEFKLSERIVLAFLVIILILLVAQSHKLVPYARIYLDPDRVRKPYSKEIPSVILGIFASIAAATLTALPKISEWITDLIQSVASLISP